MKPIIVGLAGVLVAAVAGAQQGAGATGLRTLSALRGAVTFQVPRDWHVLVEESGDTAALFVYHVRDSVVDVSSPDRTNVIINVWRERAAHNFRTFSDSLMGGLTQASMTILDDTIIESNQRAVFWRGQLKTTPYAGYDDFGNIDGVWVHIRISVPVGKDTSLAWSQRLSDATGHLLVSVEAGGHRVFPAGIGYPVLTTLGPGGTARPNEALLPTAGALEAAGGRLPPAALCVTRRSKAPRR